MSDSPDTEVAFRNPDNIEDTGAQGDDDRFDDTVEDHGTQTRSWRRRRSRYWEGCPWI
jgi:hypothetical protein